MHEPLHSRQPARWIRVGRPLCVGLITSSQRSKSSYQFSTVLSPWFPKGILDLRGIVATLCGANLYALLGTRVEYATTSREGEGFGDVLFRSWSRISEG